MTSTGGAGEPWSLRAPAKVNLALRVVGRRADGYHLLESLMVFFPLFDRLEITPLESGLELICDPPVTASPDENLVLRAARLLAQTAGVSRGARLHLTKRIPDGAGLGGGSSDAALTLMALNRLWGVNLGLEALIALGVGLGADIPFFLGGRAALVRGVGERLTPLPVPLTGELVLVFPGESLSTRRVFQALAGRQPVGRAPLGWPSAGADLADWLENDLELPAREISPRIDMARGALLEAGARAVLMSGSGSTVFGLFPSVVLANGALRQVAERHPDWRVYGGGILSEHPFYSHENRLQGGVL
ncbi:MAG: 4-(cytidine 5'-diphospho)-2-C-methyl-D-erythritol kinase [Magnetococcales bacterium]|nr:4-(cytidine 5'-diphospho)-2-C-methyl-D-erythritol kinase [Magnetococcales bacterium]